MPEHASILGIETKHDTDAKDVEPPQGGGRTVIILLEQRLINPAHDLARLHRHLHLLAKMLAIVVNEKHQTVVLLTQVLQQDAFWLAVGTLHVINQKLREVACHDPTGMSRHGEAHHIASCLLERVEHGAVALRDALTQVLAQ